MRGAVSSEETKVAAELRKMLSAPRLPVGVTCVRVPTLVAHGVAVPPEFERPLDAARAPAVLAPAPRVELGDDPGAGRAPTTPPPPRPDPCPGGRIPPDEARGPALFSLAD